MSSFVDGKKKGRKLSKDFEVVNENEGWPNGIATNGEIVVISYEGKRPLGGSFQVFDKLGKLLHTEKKRSHSCAIIDDRVVVGHEKEVGIYSIKKNFQKVIGFGYNSHPLPELDGCKPSKEFEEEMEKVNGHQGVINCVVANEKYIITGSGDGNIFFWDSKDYKMKKRMESGGGHVISLALQGDVLGVSCGNSVALFSVKTMKEMFRLKTSLGKRISICRNYLFIVGHKEVYKINIKSDKKWNVKKRGGKFRSDADSITRVWSDCEYNKNDSGNVFVVIAVSCHIALFNAQKFEKQDYYDDALYERSIDEGKFGVACVCDGKIFAVIGRAKVVIYKLE